jgi:hypothetical protein
VGSEVLPNKDPRQSGEVAITSRLLHQGSKVETVTYPERLLTTERHLLWPHKLLGGYESSEIQCETPIPSGQDLTTIAATTLNPNPTPSLEVYIAVMVYVFIRTVVEGR